MKKESDISAGAGFFILAIILIWTFFAAVGVGTIYLIEAAVKGAFS